MIDSGLAKARNRITRRVALLDDIDAKKREFEAKVQDEIAKKSIPNLSAEHSSSSYLPRFDGMYVLTETQNHQTKLFDYVEPIRKKDRVDVVDMDRDGDRDFVYLLGGVLYVKSTYLGTNAKTFIAKVDSAKTIDKSLPEVANGFNQVHSTPSELNISFQNTVSDEKEWRMEFFDKYQEWDRIDIGNSQNNSPKTTVDLIRHTDFAPADENGIRIKPVERAIVSGFQEKGFILK